MATIKSSWDCQAIDEKLGVAADAVVVDASETDNEGGILASVAALPQSVIVVLVILVMMIVIGKQVSSAAVNLLKFVTPPSSATAAATGGTQDTSGGVTYSEVLRSLYIWYFSSWQSTI